MNNLYQKLLIKMQIEDPHNGQTLTHVGSSIERAKSVMIMVHGRGASAESILHLSNEFAQQEITFIAPQAYRFSWYPYSFMAQRELNEPGLSSGLKAIHEIVTSLEEKGFGSEHIYLLGFSQGACLALEYAASHPKKYAGVFGLSGGLIGPEILRENYVGAMENTPVFLGCSDIDPHIPKHRFLETSTVFEELEANVKTELYPGMGHMVNEREIEVIQNILSKSDF